MHGGLAQGIAQALYEEAVYDDDGNLVTATLADYLVPSAADLPDLRHRPDRDAGDRQPAGRQGRRRGGHDRLDPGGGQRDRRRAAPAAASTTSRCRARRSGSGERRGRTGRGRRQGQPAAADRPEVRHDPGAFDYVRPALVDEAVARAGRRRARTRRSRRRAEPVPLLRLRLASRAAGRRGRPARAARRRATTATRWSSARMTTHHEVHPRPAGAPSTRRCSRRPPATVADPPSGTAARSAARSRTPTRPATCPRWRWRWTRAGRRGPGGEREIPAARLLRRLPDHRRWRRTRS